MKTEFLYFFSFKICTIVSLQLSRLTVCLLLSLLLCSSVENSSFYSTLLPTWSPTQPVYLFFALRIGANCSLDYISKKFRIHVLCYGLLAY